MKNLIILASIMAPTISLAMENNLQIRDRDLDTPNKPHITIINQLPTNIPLPSNQIDISDKIRVNCYNNRSYGADDSTVALYSNEGVRFSPQTHNASDEYKRLGMNNAGNAALIQIYVHAAVKNQLMKLYIGEYSKIKFGDTIAFKYDTDGSIAFMHNDKRFIKETYNGKQSHEIPVYENTETLGYPENMSRWEVEEREPLLLTIANCK